MVPVVLICGVRNTGRSLECIDISGVDFKDSYVSKRDFKGFGTNTTKVYVKNESSRNFLLKQDTPWSADNIIVGKPSN